MGMFINNQFLLLYKMGWKELPKWIRTSIYILIFIIILRIISSFLPSPFGMILSLPFILISTILALLFISKPILLALTIFKNEQKKVKGFAKGFLISSLITFIYGIIHITLVFFSIVRASVGSAVDLFGLPLYALTELVIGLILLFISKFVKDKNPIVPQQ